MKEQMEYVRSRKNGLFLNKLRRIKDRYIWMKNQRSRNNAHLGLWQNEEDDGEEENENE